IAAMRQPRLPIKFRIAVYIAKFVTVENQIRFFFLQQNFQYISVEHVAAIGNNKQRKLFFGFHQ
ncbi:MAG: hypothetical protein IKL84_01730, partial [Clostridia bacterium]|nr:hypothetical protein [Clostridia bacterium]